MIGVVALDVGFPALCLVAFLPHARHMWNLELASRRSASFCQGRVFCLSLVHVRCMWKFDSASRGLSSRHRSWVTKCRVVCHHEGHVSFNAKEVIFPKFKILTDTRTRDIGLVTLIYTVFSPKRKRYTSAPFFSCLYFPSWKKSPSGMKHGTVWGGFWSLLL